MVAGNGTLDVGNLRKVLAELWTRGRESTSCNATPRTRNSDASGPHRVRGSLGKEPLTKHGKEESYMWRAT